jgi:hypothetical protein
MEKIILATAAVLVAGTAHASGWEDSYDCGHGVIATLTGWRGQLMFGVGGDGIKTTNEMIFDHKETFSNPPDSFDYNAGRKEGTFIQGLRFHVRTRWHRKSVVFRYWNLDTAEKTLDTKVTFGGHLCRSVGDLR